MPLPDLKPGESESRADFITRCMRNKKINQEFPDPETWTINALVLHDSNAQEILASWHNTKSVP